MAVQFNAVQVTPAGVSLTGVNFSLVSVVGSGVENTSLSLSGNDVSQAIRAYQTTTKSGGFARLGQTLLAVDQVVSGFGSKEASREPEWCTVVLKKLIIRGKCAGFGRIWGTLRATSFLPPQGLGVATRRVLAISALWVEIIGSNGLGKFILECVKKVAPNSPDELQQEVSRMCSHLSDDLTLAGLGILHDGEELMAMVGEYLKSELVKSSNQGQLTKSELTDLLWTFHAGGSGAADKYWTNDALVFYTYTVLKRVCHDIPVLDYNPQVARYELEKTLLKYGNKSYSEGSMDPWLVRCSNEGFWELVWLYNRPGEGSLSEYLYLDKVKRMQDILVEHTKLSPVHTEDKGICTLVSFESSKVRVNNAYMHRAVEKACAKVLGADFAQFARVATAVEFFDREELQLSEVLGSSFAVGEFNDIEKHVSITLDLKYKTIALLVLQTIVMKSLATDQQSLILYTPAIHTGSGGLKSILRGLSGSGLCIQLWRLILISAWFIGGNEVDYNVRQRRSDIQDCVGVMGPRITVLLAGVINGSDDSIANNELWVCNGPVPDLPTTSRGLILVDSTHGGMGTWGISTDTYDQDVTPVQADAGIVIDVGPSYGIDEVRIRSWIRSDGRCVGFFNPLDAMSRILTHMVKCRCISKGRSRKSGVYHGWPVTMSELVQKPDQFNFQISNGTASKLIYLVNTDKLWRYCLAGALRWDPVIVGDCKCVLCVEEMISSRKKSNVRTLVL